MSSSPFFFPSAVRDLPSLRGVDPRKYGLGAWSDHVPFAFDLISTLRPARLVELGTFSGESYFAFCQAVAENRTRTVCYAVDTWLGDEHVGELDESAFRDVTAHNRQFYAPFSYLIRGTFDDALAQFSDGSIDLLHIDGLHTYEAVRHDFDSWLPKVSARGLVLLHDVSARHEDFGVWKFWEEIAAPGRSFLFNHGWGLGVWRKDPTAPLLHRFLERLFAAGPEEAGAIREYYERAATALRGRKTAEVNDSSDLEPTLTVQLFFPRPGDYHEQDSYAEDLSVCTRYAPGGWRKLVLPLPADYTGAPLRLDALSSAGLLDVGGVALTSQVFPGRPVWACRNRAQLAALKVTGTAEPVPHPRFLRLLSTGNDPHLLLPAITLPETDGDEPWQLEIWLRVRVSPADFLAALSPWLEAYRARPAERAELANARAEGAEARWEIKAARVEVEAAREEAKAARVEIETAHAEAEAARAETETVRAQVVAAQAETAALRASTEQKQAEMIALHAEIDAARTERLLTATELHCVSEELARQTERTAVAEAARREAVEQARTRVNELQAQLDTSEAAWRELGATLAGKEKDCQAWEADFNSRGREVDAMQEQLQKLEAAYLTELGRRRSMQRSFTWKLGLPLRAFSRLLTTGSLSPRKKK